MPHEVFYCIGSKATSTLQLLSPALYIPFSALKISTWRQFLVCDMKSAVVP